MSKTLYAQLANKLSEDIASERYPVGSLLPTEQELCEQFGASRCTVRAAIKQLKDMGMVSSRKKVGTRVEATTATTGYRQTLATVEDLLQFEDAHIRKIKNVDNFVADRTFSKDLGCLPGSRWWRISGVRGKNTTEYEPVLWTEVYVAPEYFDIVQIVKDTPDALVSQLIESHYGRHVAEIRQEIQAVLIPQSVAKELNTTVGAPAFRILRRYLDQNGELFEMSVTIHPADQFTFSMKLTRERE